MTNLPCSLSTKAVLRGPDSRCLLLRRSLQSKHNTHRWELPGGKADPGEDVGAALVREVREETGLVARIDTVIGASEVVLPDHRVAYLYFEASTPTAEVRLSDEHDAFLWVEPHLLPTHDLCPQFVDFVRDYAARIAPR